MPVHYSVLILSKVLFLKIQDFFMNQLSEKLHVLLVYQVLEKTYTGTLL